jgi:hypothetical protein
MVLFCDSTTKPILQTYILQTKTYVFLFFPSKPNLSLLTPGQVWGPVYAQRRAALQLFTAP